MTALACEAPVWSLSRIRPAADLDPVEHAIERILALRHDYDAHELAVTLLRGIRPDLERHSIESLIGCLLWQAEQIRDAETEGIYAIFDRRVDDYETSLRSFAHPVRAS